MRTRYDDGGFSGGSTDRPALQRLLADVRARKIQIIVVYKVDRLTRSLADFAKLDGRPAVQHNHLHGPAHAECAALFRPIRARGHRRAHSRDGELSIVEEEANRVRMIFERYIALGSVNRLVLELRERDMRTKIRKLSNGSTRGGVPFTQGPLFYMLCNRFYIGEVVYKGEICPGPQPPLIDRALFDAVQRRLTEQRSHQVRTRTRNGALLRGLLFDAAGKPMVATHATKEGVRYRYYVSQPYLRGHAEPPAGAIIRVPAAEIETAIAKAIDKHRRNAATTKGSTVDNTDLSEKSSASKCVSANWQFG